MDPTFRSTMRLFLESLAGEHPEPAPDPTVCHLIRPDGSTAGCGAELDASWAQHMLDVIAEAFVDPPLQPHAVHVEERFEDLVPEPRIHPDDPDGLTPEVDDSDAIVYVTGRTYLGPRACPDCAKGLTSRGFDFICSDLPVLTDLTPPACHEGCIIACGRPRTTTDG